MDGIARMMAQNEPSDYVFATGELHSVKDFVDTAFQKVGVNLEWSGEGLEETARNATTQQLVVKVDERFYRPGDIKGTCGDASLAKRELGWSPVTKLDAIIAAIIQHEQRVAAF